MVEYEYSDMFLTDSIPKQITIESDSAVLHNEDLYNQEFTLEESLYSENDLRFGSCEASVIKFKISDIFTPMTGKWLDVKIAIDGKSDDPFPVGRYKVNSDKPSADRRKREIVAYDSMYDIINSSAVNWYNKILPDKDSKVTMKQFRTSFVNHFGLEQEEITLANDDMVVEKTIEVGEGTEIDEETEQISVLKESSLSGKDVITAICEINGCFGHIGRDGKFHYIYLAQDTMGLYPSNSLFPDHAPDYLPQAETGHLYPQSPKSARVGKERYVSADYEDFICRKINKIQIRQKENDIGAQYPEGKVENENAYIIEDNFLVYGKPAEELSVIAENIFRKIKDIVYRPFSADCIGNPCLEVGDAVRIPTRYELIESYILKRTLKGIQALRDDYSAEGAERCSEKSNSVSSSILQLKGKTNTLERNVEKTVSKIEDVEKNAMSEIEQTAESITATVSKSQKIYDEEGMEITLYGYDDSPNIPYDATEHIHERYLNQSNGNLYLSTGMTWVYQKKLNLITQNLSSRIEEEAGRITLEVTNRTEGQEELSSRIEEEAGKIALKVSKGEVISEINLSPEEAQISAERINLNGYVTVSSLSGDGTTDINGANITTGKIDTERLDAETIYVEDSLKIRHTDSDGSRRVRTAVWMEDVEGQTYPNVVVGSVSHYAANVVIKNSLTCESQTFIEGNFFAEKNADVRGQLDAHHIYLDNSPGSTDPDENPVGGVYAFGSDREEHAVLSIREDGKTTWVGMPSDKSHPKTTLLRGNAVTLGSAGSITTSDKRLKNSFKPLDEFDAVYMDIEPCAFKYNNGTSGRFHFGTTAQGVKEAFEKHGYTTRDFGGFVQMADNPENEDYCGVDDPMGIIYTEFAMWNTHMIQKLFKKIEEQQSEINLLRESVVSLMKGEGNHE